MSPTPHGHALLESHPRTTLSLGVRQIEAPVAVLRRPMIFIAAIHVINRILGLVACWIDKCKRLARNYLLNTAYGTPAAVCDVVAV